MKYDLVQRVFIVKKFYESKEKHMSNDVLKRNTQKTVTQVIQLSRI